MKNSNAIAGPMALLIGAELMIKSMFLAVIRYINAVMQTSNLRHRQYFVRKHQATIAQIDSRHLSDKCRHGWNLVYVSGAAHNRCCANSEKPWAIARRLHAMTLLGRETPELPLEVTFSELKIACLQEFAAHYKLLLPTDLGSAIVTMARLAGYQNRKHDPPPGN